MKRLLPVAVLVLGVVGGCPKQQEQQQLTEEPPDFVAAHITIDTTSGAVPLTVNVSAGESTSTVPGDLNCYWDFGNGRTANSMGAATIYSTIGTHTITLEVTDVARNSDTTSVQVHVHAIPVAVILADTNAGPLPLTVHFDGSDSHVDGNAIDKYYWDFGDGNEVDGGPAPTYTYEEAGDYTVTLRVVAASGLENSTTTRITAGASIGSLQLDGEQDLWLTAREMPSDRCMFEAWFKPGMGGGLLFYYADEMLWIGMDPMSNRVRACLYPGTSTATVPHLARQWHHVAVVYDKTWPPPGKATAYLDGEFLMNIPEDVAPGTPYPYTPPGWEDVDFTLLRVGDGFEGRIAEVRWWSTPVSLDPRWSRLDPSTPNLIGNWRLDDGSGDTLTNQCGPDGVCHTYVNDGVCDLNWSADGPPLTAE